MTRITSYNVCYTKLLRNIELETWIKLYRKLADFETVAFKGQPLAGLQIMGILETRALDFDKLVILDLNEGIFPKSAPPNTFIPANLRMGFGMPTIEFQDTIFSYYFFRLIHRAKKVQITHSTVITSYSIHYTKLYEPDFRAFP